MKKIILSLVLMTSFFVSKSQISEKMMSAEVERVYDVPVFLYSYPDSSYEEVGNVNAIGSAILEGLGEAVSIRSKIQDLVQVAKYKRKKGKVGKFDAMIVNPDDYTGILIKFKGKKSKTATVKRELNVPVFVFSYPQASYEEVGNVSPLVMGNSLRAIVKQIVKRAKKKMSKGKVPKFDAILVDTDDASGILIKFDTKEK
jgi:hypothetical protein